MSQKKMLIIRLMKSNFFKKHVLHQLKADFQSSFQQSCIRKNKKRDQRQKKFIESQRCEVSPEIIVIVINRFCI